MQALGRRSERDERGARWRVAAFASSFVLLAGTASFAATDRDAAPGERGAPGLAIRSTKVLTVADELPVIDRGIVLVKDGLIERIGTEDDLDIPRDYELLDVGEHWVMPGLVDMHTHTGAEGGLNGAVYQANTGLRIHASIRPLRRALRMTVAGGVTTILTIPGSATTMGGQGILTKTGLDTYEAMLVRHYGSFKLAQADNPKAWGWGMGRLSLNWQIRNSLRLGVAYAKRWEAYERGEGPEPERRIHYDIYRDLVAGRTQVSAHTQVHQVVYQTCRIVKGEFGLPVYIDHGTMTGFLASEYANALGVPAILGPRSISAHNPGRGYTHDGKILGVAAEYQKRGHDLIGFNTDGPVVPGEELSLQSAMGARYGFDDSEMGTIRGLTINPARVAGIDDRVGSLEPGKDADLIVVTGHPSDPRNSVELVFIEGRKVYDAEKERMF